MYFLPPLINGNYRVILALVNKTNFVHNFFLSIFINLYMFRATMCPTSGETTVFMRHLVLVILCGWLSGMQEHMVLHTRQSSTQSNKYQVSHKHSCFSWCWAHSRPKHVEVDKYTKNKLCTKLALLTRFYRDTRSAKQNFILAHYISDININLSWCTPWKDSLEWSFSSTHPNLGTRCRCGD